MLPLGRERDRAMAVKLNKIGFEHAQALIRDGKVVKDDRGMWSAHQAGTRGENDFMRDRGPAEYAKWYLAIEDEKGTGTKSRYLFPFGDFESVHRCGVLAAQGRAGMYADPEFEKATTSLLEAIDRGIEKREEEREKPARRAA